MLGTLQLISTAVATALVLFWKPVLYLGGVAFVWSIIFALQVIQEHRLKMALFQARVKRNPRDLQIGWIYTVFSSCILAGFWPGLPVLIWYDYGTDDAIRSRDSEQRNL